MKYQDVGLYEIIKRGTWKPTGVVDGVDTYEMEIPVECIEYRAERDQNVYLSDFLDELPRGMFCKAATGIGGTSVILASNQPCIVAFPTRNLTINKMVVRDTVTHEITGQKTDFFCVIGGVNDQRTDLERYLEQNGTNPVKICCTYDQTYKVVENLKELGWHPRKMGLRLLIDEWHQILFDYTGERKTRLKQMLSLINDPMFKGNVTCMSATPLRREFLFDEMKELPWYSINYKPHYPEIVPSFHKSLNKDLGDLVMSFLTGKEGTANAHIFVNSIRTICSVLSDIDLSVYGQDIRIVCSETDGGNADRIRKAVKESVSYTQKKYITNIVDTEEQYLTAIKSARSLADKPIESINSPVKRINFYTATAFCGCDIFDNNAIQYVVSDGANKYTMHDVSTIFVQILGRIRDARNPQVFHWYSRNRYIVDDDGNCGYTENLALRQKFASACMEYPRAALKQYDNEFLEQLYLSLDENGNLVHDAILMRKDKMNWEVIHNTFRSSISVKAEFLKVGIKVAEPLKDDYNKTLGREIAKRPTIKTTFKQRFEFYARLRTDPQLELFQQRPFDIYVMERNDELLKPAFDIVGVDKVRALKYNVRSIKNEISSFRTGQEQRRGVSAFGLKVGDLIPTSAVKDLEKRAAQKLGVAKIKLSDYFERSNPIKVNVNGERINHYRIIGVKKNKKP